VRTVAASSAAGSILQAVVTGAFLVRELRQADLRGGPPDATATTSTNDLYNRFSPGRAGVSASRAFTRPTVTRFRRGFRGV
jgi:hypothetical protein